MFRTAIIICGCLFVLSGCVSNVEPTARIVYIPPADINLGRPTGIKPKPTPRNIDRNIPRDLYPPSRLEKKWEAIIVHHSATNNGNVAIFDKKHREENHWDGVAYDFVIGNGTDSGDGQVEVTFRWRKQMTGAHCKTPNNWANKDGIGICLVGNFNKTAPSSRQVQSLVKLIRFLKKRYGIPNNRIYGHKNTPGARVTECPGRNLSITRLRAMLN